MNIAFEMKKTTTINVQVKDKTQPTSRNMSLMCAYKLCRVEFRYWGMQTKLEKYIHDSALRRTMVMPNVNSIFIVVM